MMRKNKVCVLLSSYNCNEFIYEQVDSILRQVDVQVEIIIRDDGSTDNKSIKILHDISKLHPDIDIIMGENVGVASSFFRLMQYSCNQSNFYAFSDQDDIWEENKLLTALQHLNSNKSSLPLLFCSRQAYVSESANPIGFSSIPKRKLLLGNALIENICTGCTAVFNQNLLESSLRPFPNIAANSDNTTPVIMHDWWLYLTASATGKVIYSPKPLVRYRQHSSNLIGAPRTYLEKVRRRYQSLKKDWLEKVHRQGCYFLANYKDVLNKEDQQRFAWYEHAYLPKNIPIHLLITNKLYRQKKLDQVALILLTIGSHLRRKA